MSCELLTSSPPSLSTGGLTDIVTTPPPLPTASSPYTPTPPNSLQAPPEPHPIQPPTHPMVTRRRLGIRKPINRLNLHTPTESPFFDPILTPSKIQIGPFL